MSSDHVRCARHQWYLQQHFWAERLLQEERQRAANRAPFEHSSVVIEELDEVEEPELVTANEETELPKANEVEPELLQASEVQEPELPKANEVEEPELPTTNESEEELVPCTPWWWHDIGTQTEPTTTEASTQTLYEIRRPLFLRREASTQTLWSRGANFTRYDTAVRYQ